MDKQTTKLMFSSKSNEWTTPDDFFRKLEAKFGSFELDPAATPTTAKCKRYYTIEDDGLVQDWDADLVFCNPPYGRGLRHWIKKGYEESAALGNTVVMLVPARTDTRYWHDYVMKASEIYLVKGRLKFGGCDNSAPFPSAVVVFNGVCDGDVPLLGTIDAK